MPIGPVMLDIAGTELTVEDKLLLQNPLVGGLILFSENYQSPEQIQSLVYQIRNCRKAPILIAVDQEGGRIQRFHEGFCDIPPAAELGKLYNTDPEKGLCYAQVAGWLMASELLAVGIDLSFAPVLDLDYGLSEVIGSRSFHQLPAQVSQLGGTFIAGMHEAGMAATGKHFPGHGAVKADSHKQLPIDPRELLEINNKDLIPFKNLTTSVDAMMAAHIVFSEVDDKPAVFSSIWLQDILREHLGFEGAIFSDCLSMAGAEIIGDYPARAQAALAAGCDMVIISHDRAGAIAALESLKGYENTRAETRLLKLCGMFQTSWFELQRTQAWRQGKEALKDIL